MHKGYSFRNGAIGVISIWSSKLQVQIPFQYEGFTLHMSVRFIKPQTRDKLGRNAFFLPDF